MIKPIDGWIDRSKEKKNDFVSGFVRALTCILLLGLCQIHFGWIPDIRLIIYNGYPNRLSEIAVENKTFVTNF